MLPNAESTWTIYEAAHLLNRAGFGGRPEEIRAFHALGREKAVDHMLSAVDGPDDFPLPEWATPERMIADMRMRVQQRRETMQATQNLSPEEAEKVRREAFQKFQRENREHSVETQGWWFRRIVRTKAPLREKMTLFWHDHFATSIQKVKQPMLMLQQNELFRKHALGNFHQLTRDMVMDPAMMMYLDLQQSEKGRPNENFAREVMELFTLGEGNYSENDIREAARAFTGYRIDRLTGKAEHNRKRWDSTEKTIFGKRGNFDGRGVVDVIFEQPAVAGFLVRKLWEYFVYENPSQAAVDELAVAFRKSGFQIAPVLRGIFLSREFYSETAIRAQIKSPVQFLVQMIKQLQIERVPDGFPILAQQQLGQTLFLPPNVAGWDWGQAWINTNTLLTRYNLAGFLTKGSMAQQEMERGGGGGQDMMMRDKKAMTKRWEGPDYETIAPREMRKSSEKLVDDLLFRFFQGPVPVNARENFIEYADSKRGAVFTNQEVGELCHLMLSTPYYQLC
jgi:uncharacterized protein (DUF1800 family)